MSTQMAAQASNQPRAYSQAYLPNGAPPSGPASGATSLLPNQGRVVQAGSARVLCIADVRGHLRSLNELARSAKADYIIHTGDFGFYDQFSLDRIAEKTLRHVTQYSPLLPPQLKDEFQKAPLQSSIKDRFRAENCSLSDLPQFLNKTFALEVPVYTVWGACEDVGVLEKLRSGEYKIDNLHIVDEAHSRLLEIGGVKLRLLGLGGAVVMHKLFDNGEGKTTIAGGQGTMWTTLLQIGELVDTANRAFDPTETRLFVTHASPAREGLLNQLSVTLKADFSISAGLHFRYGSSYNEFSVNPTLDHYRGKLAASKASFNDVWDTVKNEVRPAVADNESQNRLLNLAIDIVEKMPSVANGSNPFGGPVTGATAGQVDESAFKNMWNFNLADAAFGWLVLDIEGGRIGTEMRAQGFNFAHRGHKSVPAQRAQAPPTAPSPNTTAPMAEKAHMPSANPVPNQNRTPVARPTAPQQNSQPQQNNQPQQQRAQAPPTTAPVQPASQQQMKPPSLAPPRAGPSPAPAAVPKEQGKPATPKPADNDATPNTNTTQSSSNGAEKAIPSEVKPNGTATSEKTTAPPAQSPKPQDVKPSQGIFIQTNIDDEQDARLVFFEEDRAKIVRMERKNMGSWVAQFSSPDEMQEVLARGISKDSKNPRTKLKVANPPMRHGSAGTWSNNPRGSFQGGQRGGYHSQSGGASDSEGGRGGRGGRGGARGRGGDRGRGIRGTRGDFNKAGDSSSAPAPAAAAAAPASGGDS